LSDGLLGIRFNDGSNIKLFDKINTFIALNGRIFIYTDSQDVNQSIPKDVKLNIIILTKKISGKEV
jgi:hypothetical protein